MNKKAFFNNLRSSGLFGSSLSQSQVDGINGLLEAFEQVGDGRDDTLAYGLATAYHETGRRMVPVREGFASTDEGAIRAVANLAQKRGPGSAPNRYGKPAGPYGHVYYGRGHIQLTWLDNYERSSADAGVDLVKDPDAMLDPVISARVLWLGLLDGRWNGQGHGLRHYLDRGDVTGARRTVNVQDKAAEIAGYHARFLTAITVAGGAPRPASPSRPFPAPSPSPSAPQPDAPQGDGNTGIVYGIVAAVIAMIAALIFGSL